jgi:enamine deaminase RidA (YjgF/YER057c/UK114 family)
MVLKIGDMMSKLGDAFDPSAFQNALSALLKGMEECGLPMGSHTSRVVSTTVFATSLAIFAKRNGIAKELLVGMVSMAYDSTPDSGAPSSPAVEDSERSS